MVSQISFYDKNFRAILDNATINIDNNNWSLTKRSYDKNDFTCLCQPIDLPIMPLFAVAKDEKGNKFYDCLSPLVSLNKDGKSNVVAKDLISIFDTECVFDFTKTFETISEYIQHIFNGWKAWDISGFDNIIFDISTLAGLTEKPYQPKEKKSYNALNLLNTACAVHNLFIDREIYDIKNKIIKFTVRRNDEHIINIKLEDFDIKNYSKMYSPTINTAIAMNTALNVRHDWYLLENGKITPKSSGLRDLFPTRAKIFIEDDINEADFNAIAELADNRFQETIELNMIRQWERLSGLNQGKGIYFNVSCDVYTEKGFYKRLPVGELVYKNNEKNILIRLGFKATDFIQIIY